MCNLINKAGANVQIRTVFLSKTLGIPLQLQYAIICYIYLFIY
jgi:hypothetical protein